jgi:hypothetical protein
MLSVLRAQLVRMRVACTPVAKSCFVRRYPHALRALLSTSSDPHNPRRPHMHTPQTVDRPLAASLMSTVTCAPAMRHTQASLGPMQLLSALLPQSLILPTLQAAQRSVFTLASTPLAPTANSRATLARHHRHVATACMLAGHLRRHLSRGAASFDLLPSIRSLHTSTLTPAEAQTSP